jgi:S-adenosylmethionine/arginine decarboxylase-like enzyme
MTTVCTPEQWAAAFIELGCNINQVDKELEACGISRSDPNKARQVRSEFLKQTLANMEVAKRGREQYKNWKS